MTGALLFSMKGFAQTLSMSGGLSSEVRSMDVTDDSTRLLVGGGFRYAGTDSLLARALVAWHHAAWDTAGLGGGSGDTLTQHQIVGKRVFDMAWFHDTLFCETSEENWQYDTSLHDVVYLVNGAWHPCVTATGAYGPYTELIKCNGHLFGGGVATNINGIFMPGVKEWSGGAWHALPNTPFTDPASSEVRCATFWHNKYYFAGLFLASGALRVIEYDGTDQWAPVGEGIGANWVNAIAGFGDTLYAGGFINPTVDLPTEHMRLWNGSAWTQFFPDIVRYIGQVWDMQTYHGVLYINGPFRFVGDATIYTLLRFDGHELCAIGGPTVGAAPRMAFMNDTLYYSLASEHPTLPFQWIGRLPLTDLVPDRCESIATSIPGPGTLARVRVSPDPARNELVIDLSGGAGERPSRIQLYNALGQASLTVPVRGAVCRVDVSALPAGMYSGRSLEAGPDLFFRFIKE